MIYKGFSKILEDQSNSYSDFDVIEYLINNDEYNFQRLNKDTAVLRRFQDTYFVFRQRTKIILHYIVNIDIDDKLLKKASVEIMRLSYKHKLNLAVDDNNIVSDYTIFKPNGISEAAFIQAFESFTDKIDAHRTEIISSIAHKYASSFLIDNRHERVLKRLKNNDDHDLDFLRQRLKASIEDEIDSDAEEDDDSDDEDEDLFDLFGISKEEVDEAISNGEYYIENNDDE